MQINKYTDFFHDGSIENIEHKKDEIIIWMESAEVHKDDFDENVAISKDNRIAGKLHVKGPQKITIGKLPFYGTLKKKNEGAIIFDFSCNSSRLILKISWHAYPSNPTTNDFSAIEIEAEKIWWENIPDLLDEDS